MDMITSVPNGFAAFQCGNPDKVLLIPAKELQAWSAQMNRTEAKRNAYWHVHINSEFFCLAEVFSFLPGRWSVRWLMVRRLIRS
jgi:hypothetical protein